MYYVSAFFSLNSNLVIGEELDNSNIVISSDICSLNSAYVKKIGNIVIGKISVKITVDSSGYKNILYLPKEYRPKSACTVHAVCGSQPTISGMSAFPTFIYDDSGNGKIDIYIPSAVSNLNFAICFAYLASAD